MMHREPHSREEPSRDLLIVVRELLKIGTCFVDFALFGADQQRTAKAMRGIGMVAGSSRDRQTTVIIVHAMTCGRRA